MKLLIVLVFMLSSVFCYAQAQPKYLKNAKITVTLQNGKTYTFNADEYKVVTRASSQLKNFKKVIKRAKQMMKENNRKNRVIVYGGYGKTGIKQTTVGNKHTIEQKKGAVMGIGVSRRLKGRVSGSATVLSNGTGLIGVGVDF